METVIVRDAEIMSGEPTFRGTRVLVRTLFEYLRPGTICNGFWRACQRLDGRWPCRLWKKRGQTFLPPLLAAAEALGFEVVITVDQHLPRQQDISDRALAIVLLQSRTTNIDDLDSLVPAILAALKSLRAGQVLRIGI